MPTKQSRGNPLSGALGWHYLLPGASGWSRNPSRSEGSATLEWTCRLPVTELPVGISFHWELATDNWELSIEGLHSNRRGPTPLQLSDSLIGSSMQAWPRRRWRFAVRGEREGRPR